MAYPCIPTPTAHVHSSLSSPQRLDFPLHKHVSFRNLKAFSASSSILQVPKETFPKPVSPDRNCHKQFPDDWNFFQKAASVLLDAVEGVLIRHERSSTLPKTIDPRHQIAGNYAPVPETPLTQNLRVLGKIPDCIDGVYLRNGANPLFDPVSGHHLFDGDGMIHAVKITNGSASYACRLTETERLVQEKQLGRPVFPKPIGELHGHFGIARLALFYARGLCGIVDHRSGAGVANAGVVYFNGRLLAMSEDDLPYHIRITREGDLQTLGRFDFENQLKTSMIAHPKIDPETGELLSLSYDVVKRPYLTYFKFSPDGRKSPSIEISLSEPTMIHDFAITKNFIVIPDHQVVFKLGGMVSGKSPVTWDSEKVSRFGVLSKNAKDASGICWIDSPDTFCFHLWNAWEVEQSEEVVVIGSCMTPPDSIFNERETNLKSVLTEFRLNLKTGKASKQEIISGDRQINLEAGMVNRNLLGRPTRYAYLAITEPWPKVLGFAKVDLFTGELRKYTYGDRRYGGEPFFVPRSNFSGAKEDDGHILTFVHDEKTGESDLQIVNAADLRLEATVKMPSRVPYGFHGTFVSSENLLNQA